MVLSDTIAGRGICPFVDEAAVMPLDVQGVLEGVLRFFNQIKTDIAAKSRKSAAEPSCLILSKIRISPLQLDNLSDDSI